MEYILPLVHREKNKLTIVTCSEEESASVAWARNKDGVWKNKTITSEDFIEKLYRMMKWDRSCRYKVMGKVADSSQGLVLVFELKEAIMFAAKPMEFVDEETGTVKKKQVKYYPDEYKERIGKSYNDYVASRQINMFEYLEEYVGQTYSDMTAKAETEAAVSTEAGEHPAASSAGAEKYSAALDCETAEKKALETVQAEQKENGQMKLQEYALIKAAQTPQLIVSEGGELHG